MSRVLLTGGAGFIGRELLRRLNAAGHDVDVLDTEEAMCKNARFIPRFKRYVRKLTQAEFSSGYYSFVIHAGAISDTRWPDEKELIETNYILTDQLATYCKAALNTRMVYVSSASVYGDLDCLEDTTEFQPQTPYAMSKLMGDHMLRGENGFCIVRPFNVYGIGEHTKAENTRSLVYRIAEHAVEPRANVRERLLVHSEDARRDFVSVEDVASSIVSLMESDPASAFGGQVFNLGTGVTTSVKTLREEADRIAGDGWRTLGPCPFRPGDYQMTSRALFRKGFRPYDPLFFRSADQDVEVLINQMKSGVKA